MFAKFPVKRVKLASAKVRKRGHLKKKIMLKTAKFPRLPSLVGASLIGDIYYLIN